LAFCDFPWKKVSLNSIITSPVLLLLDKGHVVNVLN
jgi:hypothetical protein